MRASLEHEEVEVVAVNDPFIDLEYMVSNIPRVCVYLNICDTKIVISSVSWKYLANIPSFLRYFYCLKLFQSFALTSILS